MVTQTVSLPAGQVQERCRKADRGRLHSCRSGGTAVRATVPDCGPQRDLHGGNSKTRLRNSVKLTPYMCTLTLSCTAKRIRQSASRKGADRSIPVEASLIDWTGATVCISAGRRDDKALTESRHWSGIGRGTREIAVRRRLGSLGNLASANVPETVNGETPSGNG
jgi:hypothetical protein